LCVASGCADQSALSIVPSSNTLTNPTVVDGNQSEGWSPSEADAILWDVRNEDEIPSPLQDFFWNWWEQGIAAYGRSLLIQDCMTRLGREYPLPSPAKELRSRRDGARAANARLFGISDEEQARTYGYGVPTDALRDEASQPADSVDVYALFGPEGFSVDGASGVPTEALEIGPVPSSGCIGEADERIGAPPEGFSYQLGRQLWIEASGAY
jgi:hypothetical protein